MPLGANLLNALEVVQYTTSNDLASSSCMSSCFSLYLCLPIFHPPLSPLGVDLAIHKSRVHKLFPHSRYRAISYNGQHASAQQIQRGDSQCTGAAEYFFHAEFNDIVAAAISCVVNGPQSLAGAWFCSDWPQWREATDKGIETLERMGPWEIVLRPMDKKLVRSKWAFCIKCKADRVIDKYKVWLIAHSFMQICEVDYFTTYYYLFTGCKAYKLLNYSSGKLKAVLMWLNWT